MDFPDAVAACPQRTFAILTKYSSLRSYREQVVKGSALDYENAGIYTSALFDAYMVGYLTRDLDEGCARIMSQESTNLVSYSEKFKKDYEERISNFKAAEKKLVTSVRANYLPLLKNRYLRMQLSLTRLISSDWRVQKKDCRFEMIKIANEVAFNPEVATDPYRLYSNLGPNIFQMLLPSTKDTKQPLTPGEEEALRKETTDVIEAKYPAALRHLRETASQLEAQRFKNRYEAIKKQQYEESEPWRKAGEEQRSQQIHAQQELPKLEYELKLVRKRQKLAEEELEKQQREKEEETGRKQEEEKQKNWRKKDGKNKGDSIIYYANAGWLAFEAGAEGIASGQATWKSHPAYQNHLLKFSRPFNRQPAVFVGLRELDIAANSHMKVQVNVAKARDNGLGIFLGSYVLAEANSQNCKYTRLGASYVGIEGTL
ncbi:hypothetical protein B0O99DRAFT_695347 [Bisporella sp. PMI_857]|nr:hypothetical protein B0O99DRAFT_695347 [Bisporella sp. PMI_857]